MFRAANALESKEISNFQGLQFAGLTCMYDLWVLRITPKQLFVGTPVYIYHLTYL